MPPRQQSFAGSLHSLLSQLISFVSFRKSKRTGMCQLGTLTSLRMRWSSSGLQGYDVRGDMMSELYDEIGKTYDTTRKADPEIVHRLRQHLQVRNQDKVLDVACGTGNYTVALFQQGLNMTGTDISEEMLTTARQKFDQIPWIKSDARNLPFDDASHRGATCILAIHHFGDLLEPFREVYRVLDHGRFVIFTSSPEQMRSYWLNAYFPNAMEASIKQMPSLDEVIHNLRLAGFSVVGVESFLVEQDLRDFFLYSGKFEPYMYLDSTVRSGISTFANLATPEEIASGCLQLKRDIENGTIQDVIQRYTSTLGDYTFVVAQK